MSISQIQISDGAIKTIAPAAKRPKPQRGNVWLDLSAPTAENLNWIARTYK
jgi:Mg2+ and Co2+ transporter CorA